MYCTAGDTPIQEKNEIEDSSYGAGSKMANAVLKVEGQELHVHKEVRLSQRCSEEISVEISVLLICCSSFLTAGDFRVITFSVVRSN